jgi:uncharacterized protein (TIGR03067 family)
MKRIALNIIMFLSTLDLLAFAQAVPATAPANPLIGRWQVLSIGKKSLPDNVKVVWSIDETSVVVTLNGEVATQSTYVLKPDEEPPTIEMTERGKTVPDRVGWYELKNGRLRLQVTLLTGKPPAAWNDDEVIVMKPLEK